MSTRRPRKSNTPEQEDDVDLWARLTQSVKPLKKQAVAVSKSESLKKMKRLQRQDRPKPQGAVPQTAQIRRSAAQSAKTSTNTALDPNEVRKIRRGQHAIEARLDLHGLSAEAAHMRLTQFIAQAHAEKLAWVLIITGKGSGGQGLLRRSVPQWLTQPPLAEKVIGTREALPAHGGGGALYVRLRRKR